MVLAPEQIETREFVTTLRGFDRHEVQAFLRAIADDYRRLLSGQDSARPDPADDPDQHVVTEMAGILRAGREAAQRAREEAENQAREAVLRGMRRADELAATATRELAESRARATALEAEAQGRAAEIVDRAHAEANAIVDEAEQHRVACTQEAADVLERARAAALATTEAARTFSNEMQAEALGVLARARKDADAIVAAAEARRQQLLAAHASAMERLSGTDAAVRSLLEQLELARGTFTEAGGADQERPAPADVPRARSGESRRRERALVPLSLAPGA